MTQIQGSVGAIVGFGLIAETTHLEALNMAGLRVVAVVETSPERRARAREMLPQARIYTDVAELLQAERLDFVDICTPPHLHFDAIVRAVRAGVHVLCEKPLVLTAREASEVAARVREHQVALACVHNWTAAPIFRRVRELLADGGLGGLRHMDITTLRTAPAATVGDVDNWRIDAKRAGGGILFDHGWHGTSLLLRTAAARPLEVHGRVENRRYAELGVEDTSDIRMSFPHGVTGHFEATWAADERANRAEFCATGGTLRLHNDTLEIWKGNICVSSETFGESLAGGGYRPGWTAHIARDFHHAMRHPEAREALLEEAVTVLQVLTATYASARSGGIAVPLSDCFAPPLPQALRV